MAGKPGRSGRKRDGDETKVYFNSRIDPDLRKELEAAAEASGRSLSAEIEERLRNSLVPAGKLDEATRALTLLIAEASKETADGKRNWTNDPHFHIAFRRAVTAIINMASDASTPRRMAANQGKEPRFDHPVFRSVDEMARHAILRIANDLAEAKTPAYARAFRALGNPKEWLQWTRAHWKTRDLMTERIDANPKMTDEEIQQAALEIVGGEPVFLKEDAPPQIMADGLARFGRQERLSKKRENK